MYGEDLYDVSLGTF